MSTRTSYAPGTFALADLRTTDLAGAKRFYTELFGWTYCDVGQDSPYIAAALHGDAVAVMKPLAEGWRGARGGPFWLTYVAVASAEEATARTGELGGTVHIEPSRKPSGRVAVIADPTGASLCLWESSPEGMGACRVDELGCVTSTQLHTTDVPRASRFYAELFGWRIDPAGPGTWTISLDRVNGEPAGGVRELDAALDETFPQWVPHFAVTALPETLARATDAGGQVLTDPVEQTTCGVAILRDPQGAVFGVVARPVPVTAPP